MTHCEEDECVVGAHPDGDDGREDVHEGKEVDLEDEGVDEVGGGQGVEDGHQGPEGHEEAAGEGRHGPGDQEEGHRQPRRVLHQVLVEKGVFEA